MKTISTITILPLTKEQRVNYINNVIEEFNNLNEFEQQKIFVQMKIAIETIDKIMKHRDVRGAIIDRMENNKIENNLGEISLSYRKTYDYSCDSKWHELNEGKKAIERKLKMEEGILKSLSCQVADVESGEIRTPATYKESEIITIKIK